MTFYSTFDMILSYADQTWQSWLEVCVSTTGWILEKFCVVIYVFLNFSQWNLFTQATSDVNLKKAAVLKALCLYLGEDDRLLIRECTKSM